MTKAMARRAVPISVPITSEFFQDFSAPAHRIASVKQTTEVQIRVTPIRSICKNISRAVAGTGAAAFGGLKARRIARAATPPQGRLI